MGELVELVKASIDPETMITEMRLNGSQLTEDDWRRNLSSIAESCIEMVTGNKKVYVLERVVQSPFFLRQVVDEFVSAKNSYRSGETTSASQIFKTAVNDLHAFMNWYLTLLSLEQGIDKGYIDQLTAHIEQVTRISERLVNAMLFNAWWAVAETLERDLEPELNLILKALSSFAETVTRQKSVSA